MKIYLMKKGYRFEYEYPEEDFIFEVKDKLIVSSLLRHKGSWYAVDYIEEYDDRCVVREIKIKKEPEEICRETFITCPFCEYEDKDSFEASDYENEYKCGNCGSIFSYERIVDVSYSSSSVKFNENIIEVN